MPDVDVFSALANPVRRDILKRLRKGPQAVNELAKGFDLGRPAVSEHLQVLRKAGLVREQPRGQQRFYHLDPRPLSQVEDWLEAFSQYWTRRMAALDDVLNEEKKKLKPPSFSSIVCTPTLLQRCGARSPTRRSTRSGGRPAT